MRCEELDKSLDRDVRMQKLLELAGRGGRTLDLGCYSGYLMDRLSERGHSVYGADSNKYFVEYCRGKGLKVELCSMERVFPFVDGAFDTVIAGELIEHIYDTDLFLSECARVLKPGGRLLITTPNLGFWKHRLKLLLGLNMPFEYGAGKGFVNHIRYFNLTSFQRAIQHHPFTLTREETSYWFSGDEGRSFLNFFIPNIFKRFGFHLILELKKNEL
jgi:SAM-dependent methyltransferase